MPFADLLPTSVLHKYYYDGYAVTENPFSGGIIRIESTDSTWINSMYPAEYTPVLTDGTQSLLKQAGHSGRHFNSLISRVVGAFALPSRPDDSPFVKFTLPAFEVRRLLKEARAKNDSFSLEYSRNSTSSLALLVASGPSIADRLRVMDRPAGRRGR